MHYSSSPNEWACTCRLRGNWRIYKYNNVVCYEATVAVVFTDGINSWFQWQTRDIWGTVEVFQIDNGKPFLYSGKHYHAVIPSSYWWGSVSVSSAPFVIWPLLLHWNDGYSLWLGEISKMVSRSCCWQQHYPLLLNSAGMHYVVSCWCAW